MKKYWFVVALLLWIQLYTGLPALGAEDSGSAAAVTGVKPLGSEQDSNLHARWASALRAGKELSVSLHNNLILDDQGDGSFGSSNRGEKMRPLTDSIEIDGQKRRCSRQVSNTGKSGILHQTPGDGDQDGSGYSGTYFSGECSGLPRNC